MPTARQAFFERLNAYKLATQADIIVSRDPTEMEHNARARLFRNGLAVVGFAITEDFIKTRTAEVLQRIGSGVTAFSDLPSAIKNAATLGVVKALKFQEKFYDRRSSDYYRFFQDHARAVASTATVSYEISSIALGYDQSNITSNDILDILSAFGVETPWSTLGSVASRCGVGAVDLKSAFENASSRRHKAAHRASSDIETSELINFGSEVVGIALALDLLLSRALRKILDGDRDYLSNRTKIAGRDLSFRFLQYDGSQWWRETVDDKPRASARNTDFNMLKTDCIGRARSHGQAVVLKGLRGFPTEWFTPEID